MNSQMTNSELPSQLQRLGLRATAEGLDDLLARATTGRWSPLQLVEEIARLEIKAKAARNLQRRLKQAALGRFKPLADFDWNWPTRIDRAAIERALLPSFIEEKKNLILLGSNGLGKTSLAKGIAYQAILAGHSAIFRTASELIGDLSGESPQLRKRKLSLYSRVDLLCIDEVAYLSYDSNAADLLFEVVSRRYESGAIVMTSNRGFKEWNEVFPHATCIATMLDRLLHYAEVVLIEGKSWRVRESEAHSAARRQGS
jgi:DNA replication protein DnaC